MPPTRVAIAGLGAIGRVCAVLARKLADGVPGSRRSPVPRPAITPRRRTGSPPRGLHARWSSLETFPDHADLAVECAPPCVLIRICRPMLEAGKQVMGARGRQRCCRGRS